MVNNRSHLTDSTSIIQCLLIACFTLSFNLVCVADDAQPSLSGTNQATILIMGDSLSAGFGMEASKSWPTLLQQRLVSENLPHQVINASISGETTNGGLSRLPQLLRKHEPQIVVIELGANDGLRGLPLKLMRENLRRMIEICQQTKARLLLVGMKLPPNYGPRYTRQFTQIYIELAEKYHTGVVPFLLTEVATKPELMQTDGLHPTAAAQKQLLNTVWPQLLPLLK